MTVTDTTRVVVCDKCLRACCWQGVFMCEAARGTGTVVKTVAELRALPDDGNREHPDYWESYAEEDT